MFKELFIESRKDISFEDVLKLQMSDFSLGLEIPSFGAFYSIFKRNFPQYKDRKKEIKKYFDDLISNSIK